MPRPRSRLTVYRQDPIDMLFDERSTLLVSKDTSDVTEKFRFWHLILVLALLSGPLLDPTTSSAEDTYELQNGAKTGDSQKVKLVLEVVGDLKLNPDGKKVKTMPLKVRGEQVYEERFLAYEPSSVRSIRHYRVGRGVIQIGDHKQSVELGTGRQLVLVESEPEGNLEITSPVAPLTRDELELLDIQGNSCLLSRLLPEREVRKGESWEHPDSLASQLLGLEAIQDSDLRSTLRKVDQNLAIIDLKGAISGAVGGVSSDIQLAGVYNFDLKQKIVTWLALKIEEKRAIGHAQPGFEVTARLRVAPQPAPTAAELSDDALAGLSLQGSEGGKVLAFESSEGGFAFHHPRSWYLMINRHDVSVLRMIERGDLVAQCNASNLARLDAGKRVELESFQADVKRALGENFGQFVEASQKTDEDGIQVLRTVVSGTVSDLPIQWTYYHLSNADGRQASLVFTMDSKLVEKFAESDQTLVETFRFTQLPEPVPAPEPTVEVKAVDNN